MKNIMKSMIAFLLVTIVCLLGIMVYGIVGGTGNLHWYQTRWLGFGEAKLMHTEIVALDEIAKITIQNDSCDIVFLSSEDNQLTVKEYSRERRPNSSFTKVVADSGILTIAVESNMYRYGNLFGGNQRYLEVYLPTQYDGSIAIDSSSGDIDSNMALQFLTCQIETSSGDVELAQLTAETIIIKTSSGDISIKEGHGQQEIKTQSGDVDLLSGSGDVEISTSSGDVNVIERVGNVTIDTTSGRMKAKQLSGGAKIKSTSGDIQISFSDLMGTVDLESTSGDVECRLPAGTKFQSQTKTRSGDIKNDFDQNLNGSNKEPLSSDHAADSVEPVVSVNTISGDINIIKQQ